MSGPTYGPCSAECNGCPECDPGLRPDAEKDAGDFGHAAQDVEELASLIQETFPTGAGGYSLIWEDCFPAAAAILDAGWTRSTSPGE